MRMDKQDAIRLRQQGMSYGMIHEKLGVPKATLSNWLRDIPFRPNDEVLERIKNGQGVIGLRRHSDRLKQVDLLKEIGMNEIGSLSRRDLWMIGLGLWIGEGSKTIEQIRLVNSDPVVIKLFIRWLHEICELDDSNITLAMHIYPDSDEQLSMEYWMGVTGLGCEQFRKTQIDKRTNKRTNKAGKLPHGTLHVTVISNGDPERGIRLHRKMMGWVAGAQQINSGGGILRISSNLF